MKRVLVIAFTAIAAAAAFTAGATKMSDLKIYINPGHGGYDSDDRPIQIYPFSSGDTLGYWESKSNLYKGLHMYHILDSLGTTAYLSRTTNTTDDDRALASIANEANNLGVDLFFAIHSNAGENVNYPLTIYRENSIGVPRYEENVTLSKLLWNNLHSNQLPVWTSDIERVTGDLTFYEGIYSNGLGVLRPLYVVGLLSEGEMHEHRPETYRLMNDDYMWLEAWHFVKTIMEYFDTEDKFVTGNVAGIVYDDHNLREKDMQVLFSNYGRDTYAPINGAYIELVDENGTVVQHRTTDDMYNGVFVFRNVSPGNYTLKTSHGDYYDEEYQVTVTANQVTYQDVPMAMKRQFPLSIVSYSPDVDIDSAITCATTIDFVFNTDVDAASFENAFSISPEVEGYFKYSESYTKVSFIPNLSLDVNTVYTVTVDSSASHPDTKYEHPQMEETLTFSFATLDRNRLEIIDYFPASNGTVHYESPVFEFRFDKTIDISDVYNEITVYDSNNTVLTVNKRSCQFNKLSNGYGNAVIALTNDLTVGEKYRAVLSGELRDTENLPMAEDMEIEFYASDESQDQGGTILEDFEGTSLFAYNAESTTGTGSSTPTYTRNTSQKLFDKSSGKFGYKFTDSHDGVIVWDYSGDQAVAVVKGDVLGAYVYGDFNNHELYIGVTSGTDTKYEKLCDLDFRGWQYHEVEMSSLEEGYNYLLTNVKLVQVTSPITQEGSFSIDNLIDKGGDAGIEAVTYSADEIKVYPVPASEVIFVEAPADVKKLELINMQGAVAAACANTGSISVDALPAGIYLLRIVTDDQVTVKRVAVKR